MKFLGLVPMLHTDDMAETWEWYASVLGFAPLVEGNENWCNVDLTKSSFDRPKKCAHPGKLTDIWIGKLRDG